MRPSKDTTWLEVACALARQSTCLRRAVGCVLIDKHGEVDGTGWNGVASGQPHCNEGVTGAHNWRDHSYTHPHNREDQTVFKCAPCGRTLYYEPTAADRLGCVAVQTHPSACAGAHSPSGTNLDGCEALHAEWNALSQCSQKWDLIACYVTHSPCMTCTKLLLNTGVQRIVFINEYAHNEAAKGLWERVGRTWNKYDK